MTKSLKSLALSTLLAGAAVAACVSGTAIPASAAPAQSPAAADVSANEDGLFAGHGAFHAEGGLQLTLGRLVKPVNVTSDLYIDAHGVQVLSATWKPWAFNGMAAAMIPILKDGKWTGFQAIAKIKTGSSFGDAASAECVVTRGDQRPGAVPFTCETKSHSIGNEWDFTVKPSDR